MLEQNDVDNLRNEIEHTERGVSSAASKYSVQRDANRTQTRR